MTWGERLAFYGIPTRSKILDLGANNKNKLQDSRRRSCDSPAERTL